MTTNHHEYMQELKRKRAIPEWKDLEDMQYEALKMMQAALGAGDKESANKILDEIKQRSNKMLVIAKK